VGKERVGSWVGYSTWKRPDLICFSFPRKPGEKEREEETHNTPTQGEKI